MPTVCFMEAYKILSIEELSIVKLNLKSDGRVVSIPLVWFPRLRNATKDQFNNFEISPSGYGIHWPAQTSRSPVHHI